MVKYNSQVKGDLARDNKEERCHEKFPERQDQRRRRRSRRNKTNRVGFYFYTNDEVSRLVKSVQSWSLKPKVKSPLLKSVQTKPVNNLDQVKNGPVYECATAQLPLSVPNW